MLALTISAELNGITDLVPHDTQEEPFYYNFKVQCTSCREIHPNWVSLSRFEKNELSGSRGEANFVWKCKECKREHSANIKDEAPKAYSQESKKGIRIIEIDCRGLEFVDFKADGAWDAHGIESSTKFSDIDISEGEWFDYDEKTGQEVSITELKFTIERA